MKNLITLSAFLILFAQCLTVTKQAFAESEPVKKVICKDASNKNVVLVVFNIDSLGQVASFYATTPGEYLWDNPGFPGRGSIPEGKSDSSPDLARNDKINIMALRDDYGEFRGIVIAPLTPTATEVEGFKASLLVHSNLIRSMIASYYFEAEGNLSNTYLANCSVLSLGEERRR